MKDIKPAVLFVGGWYDAEDLAGPIKLFYAMEKNGPRAPSTLVMGPWRHGGWSRGDGDALGNLKFGSKTAEFYREKIEFPFFLEHLKGPGAGLRGADGGAGGTAPKAWLFATGANEWRRHDAWPPREAREASLYLLPGGKLGYEPAAAGRESGAGAYDEYVSDPGETRAGHRAHRGRHAGRLHERGPALCRAPSGCPRVRIGAANGGRYDRGPGLAGAPGLDVGDGFGFRGQAHRRLPGRCGGPRAESGAGAHGRLPAAGPRRAVPGQVPQEPGRARTLRARQGRGDRFCHARRLHTFKKGHRIMVHIQSSWFPLVDRNPQTFVDIPRAVEADFQKAVQRVYRGGPDGSRVRVRLLGR